MVFGEDGIYPAKSDFGDVANLDKLIDEMRLKDQDLSKASKNAEKGMEKAGLKASREILKKAAQKAEKRKPEVSEITLADLTKAITAKIDEKEENSERIREILNEDFHRQAQARSENCRTIPHREGTDSAHTWSEDQDALLPSP